MLTTEPCNLCPRKCGARRSKEAGFCGSGSAVRAARAALHFWEEPCISGKNGSGAVFFCGCPLHCVFCQNSEISGGSAGREISVERLSEIFLELQEKGAHNINLVTPSHYLPQICRALDLAKPALVIPVVYNCGGYERVEAVRALKDTVDIFLPDFKYFSPELSQRYSGARDYFEIASAAVKAMVEQAGPPVFGEDGLLRRGVVIRHMVLPGARKDSMEILRWLKQNLPEGSFLLSLMSQYTPYRPLPFKELNRRVTSFEYDSVVEEALRLGLTNGFMQEKSSAREEYTPPFDGEGL